MSSRHNGDNHQENSYNGPVTRFRSGLRGVVPRDNMRNGSPAERHIRLSHDDEETHDPSGDELSDRDDHRSFNDVHNRNNPLTGDYMNIAILVFLYVLQGIPLGLAGSIPLILQNRKASYGQQAIFSFVNWPFSVKLLWAPIVDSVFNRKFGRRKSWLVPVQYLIGIFMMVLSYRITSLLGSEDYSSGTHVDNNMINDTNIPKDDEKISGSIDTPDVYTLTFVFLCLNFLAATQDIAVDGWALTMLKKRNVGYASTCNTVGQTAGFFLGNVVFLALESASFCNKFFWFLRHEPSDVGMVTLSGFLYFWGIIFLVTTTIVMIFKGEKDESTSRRHLTSETSDNHGIIGTYLMLYKILKLPSVRLFVLVLFTCKMGFAASDSVTGLKLLEKGVKKEHLAILAVPLVPLQIILPWVLSKYTAGPKPLDIFLKAYPYRLFIGLSFTGLLYWTSLVKDESSGEFPFYYYLVVLILYAVHQIFVFSVYVSLMGFHAKISDPSIGGTYMTLLNTLTNLGGNWPSTLSLWAVEKLNIKSCPDGNNSSDSSVTCSVLVDGYYIESLICFIIGFLWLSWGKSKVRKLQNLPLDSWKVRHH